MRLLVIIGLWLGFVSVLSACQPISSDQQGNNPVGDTNTTNDIASSCENKAIIQAFNAQKSDVQVKGCGNIEVVLPDDTKGSQHQRLIVALSNTNPNIPQKHTVLIAHNIDLAPKALTAKAGKAIRFYGEYEYNPKGGVVHWTHHDPAGRHQGGWIEIDGKRYE